MKKYLFAIVLILFPALCFGWGVGGVLSGAAPAGTPGSAYTDVTATLSYQMRDQDATYVTARDNISASNNSSGGAKVGQNTDFNVYRGYLEFPIPALSSVASCYLYMYGSADNSTTDFVITLFTGSWSSMATSEWDQFDGWTSGSAHTGTDLTDGWNTSGYSTGWNIIELNADGRAAIFAAKETTIKIAVISGEDVSRSQPSDDEYVEFESKDDAGKEPFLRITE
jgi:hypothetical protein